MSRIEICSSGLRFRRLCSALRRAAFDLRTRACTVGDFFAERRRLPCEVLTNFSAFNGTKTISVDVLNTLSKALAHVKKTIRTFIDRIHANHVDPEIQHQSESPHVECPIGLAVDVSVAISVEHQMKRNDEASKKPGNKIDWWWMKVLGNDHNYPLQVPLPVAGGQPSGKVHFNRTALHYDLDVKSPRYSEAIVVESVKQHDRLRKAPSVR